MTPPYLYTGELADQDVDLLVQLLSDAATDRARRIPEDQQLVARLARLARLFRSCSGVVIAKVGGRAQR